MSAIICMERRDSGPIRSDDARSFETHWDIFKRRGSDVTPMTQLLAESALRTFAPFALADTLSPFPFFANFYSVEMVDGYTATGTVTYKYDDPIDNLPPPQNGADFSPPSFRVHGETINVKLSRATVSANVAAGSAFPYGGAINVTENGDVQGVDILVPRLQFTIPRYYPIQIVSADWIKALAFLTGTVCLHRFMSFDIGEIMLLGVEGAPNFDKQRMELTLHFDTSPNVTGIDIAAADGTIEIDEKRGFDYLWLAYNKDSDADRLGITPVQANVERVYRYEDWSILGFG